MKYMQRTLLSVLVTGALTGLAACGGGGGGSSSSNDNNNNNNNNGGSVTGLAMPTKLSVVTAVDSTNAKVEGMNLPYGAVSRALSSQVASFAADSDYNQDQTKVWVHDESMDALGTVNMILCLMDQTNAGDMVNQGAYVALVNETKCEEGKSGSGGAQAGQTNTTNVTQLNRWTIESTRADNTSPQHVKIWVPGRESQDPKDSENIMVEVSITEAASDAKPFGAFTLNFEGVVDAGLMQGGAANGNMMTLMKGTLIGGETDVGQPHFQFINVMGRAMDPNFPEPMSHEQAADVVLNDATGTGGVAKTKSAYSETRPGEGTFSGDERFVVAFDQRYMLRGKFNGAGTLQDEVCLDRENFNTNIWRYNLYTASNGTRVTLNSGFPFTYNAGNRQVNGHVGYWGLWMEDESMISQMDGETITSHDWTNNTDNDKDYTVAVAPGKTIKRTANPTSLLALGSAEFNSWMTHPTLGYPREPVDPMNPNSATKNNYDSWVVVPDAASGKFRFMKGVNWGNNGPVYTDLAAGDQVLYTPSFDGENLWLWSDALGGNVVYVYNQTTPTSSKVTFYSQENVYPNDTSVFPAGTTSVALWCFDRCPKGGITQAQIGQGQAIQSEWDLFYTQDYANPQFFPYTLSQESGKIVLRDGTAAGNPVVDASALDLSSIGISWGMSSGEMVTTDVKNANINTPWMIFQDTTASSFRWETGSQSWNRLVSVMDGTQLVQFDKPLKFKYTVDANDVLNTVEQAQAGQIFMLEYGGEGQLWGFPWAPDVNCTDATGQNCRWYPAANLHNGVVLTDANQTDYVVKGLEGEQTIKPLANTTACTAPHTESPQGLNVQGLYPTLTLPDAGNLGDVTFAWADLPAVTDAPAVVDGVTQ